MVREWWEIMPKNMGSWHSKVAGSESAFSHLTPSYCGFMQLERYTTFRGSTDAKLCDYRFQVKSFRQLLETLTVKWRRKKKKECTLE
jgi:hypothetical protein